MELIRDAIADGGAISAVVDAVAERINDDARNQCDPNLDNYGDYEYSEHDYGQIWASGSTRVRQSRAGRGWLNRSGFFKYFRAVFRSIPLFNALIETLPLR